MGRFEASSAAFRLAGTGTLNRGVTVNRANYVIIMNLEWSPETTLQAEDRCHRPGQTREVHVHYILSGMTVDEQMNDLIMQKWAAQRAVQDREAQHKSVEAILQEAALANAQLAVARAVLSSLRLPPTATAEEREAAVEQVRQAVEQINDWQAFRQKAAALTAVRRRQTTTRQAATPAVYIGTLFGSSGLATPASDKPTLALPVDEVVQLAFF